MFTIKQAARVAGVTEATLRTWERRYSVVAPERTQAGYRLYDAAAVATLQTMRNLLDEGWSPSAAARAVLDGDVELATASTTASVEPDTRAGAAYRQEFLAAAAALDSSALERSLDGGMSIGSFEHAVHTWLFPTLEALGEGWANREIDVAGEHLASHHVLRRLAAAFEAAGTRARGPRVVVGLPPGSRHELGALAFATAGRRLGLDVLFLGADVPHESWVTAARQHRADAAVLAVVTPHDRTPARRTIGALRQHDPNLVVAVGGASASRLRAGALELPPPVGEAAAELDDLLART